MSDQRDLLGDGETSIVKRFGLGISTHLLIKQSEVVAVSADGGQVRSAAAQGLFRRRTGKNGDWREPSRARVCRETGPPDGLFPQAGNRQHD